MNFLDIFLHDLLREAGLSNPADFGTYIEDLRPLLIQRIFLSTMGKLSEEQKHIAEQKIDISPDAFHAYCASCIPEYDNFVGDVCVSFGDDYLEGLSLAE